jgi:hypothetical protein
VYNEQQVKGVLMISTVTTSTVSNVLVGSIALIGIFFFFALLVQKEITTTATGSRMKRLGQALNVAILPLLIAFILIVVTKVIEYLR